MSDAPAAPVAPPVEPGTAPAATPPATPPTSPISWLSGADEATVGYVQNKGWTEPAQVLEGYRNLEKLLGADRAGNTVILPKAGATPEEMGAFFERLGRPASPDGYSLEVPEGHGDKDYAVAAAAKFHELGLSKSAAEDLVKWNNQYTAERLQANAAAAQQAFQADDAALRTEWGAAFDQNINIAKQAVQALGLKADVIDGLSSVIGHKAAMNFFKDVGVKVMEDTFVGGETTGFNSVMTPGQAKAEIASLRQDKTFVSQYLNKDRDAVVKMQRLMAMAYPEGS